MQVNTAASFQTETWVPVQCYITERVNVCCKAVKKVSRHSCVRIGQWGFLLTESEGMLKPFQGITQVTITSLMIYIFCSVSFSLPGLEKQVKAR